MIRVRFGMRNLIPFLPNAGVLVGKCSATDVPKVENAVEFLKQVMTAAGLGPWADKLFFEKG